jgi:hypothetical protein
MQRDGDRRILAAFILAAFMLLWFGGAVEMSTHVENKVIYWAVVVFLGLTVGLSIEQAGKAGQ